MKNSTSNLPSFIFLLLLALAIAISGCRRHGCTDPTATNYDPDAKKDDGSCEYASAPKIPENTDVTSEQDFSKSEAIDNNIETEMDVVMKDTFFYKNQLFCGTIEPIDTSWGDNDGPGTQDYPGKRIAINYGSGIAADTCLDGTKRGGKIFVRMNAPWYKPHTIYIDYENFYIDSNKIEGNKSREFLRGDGSTTEPLTWENIINQTITTRFGKTIKLHTERYKYVYGDITANPPQWDSIAVIITTKESALNQNGKSFTVETEQRLVRVRGCDYIDHGILKITTVFGNGDEKVRRIDFGFGDCEHALVTNEQGVPIDTLDLTKLRK